MRTIRTAGLAVVLSACSGITIAEPINFDLVFTTKSFSGAPAGLTQQPIAPFQATLSLDSAALQPNLNNVDAVDSLLSFSLVIGNVVYNAAERPLFALSTNAMAKVIGMYFLFEEGADRQRKDILIAGAGRNDYGDFWLFRETLKDDCLPTYALPGSNCLGGITSFQQVLSETPVPIPEPGSLGIFFAGLMGLVAVSLRQLWRAS